MPEYHPGVVGTVDCTVLPNLTRRLRRFMLVENVVVAEAARRRGVGVALFDAAHDFYQAQGFEPVARGFRRYL
jgi:predicted GNAT superfamily acetyltransferase